MKTSSWMLCALVLSGCSTTPTAPGDASAADVYIPSSITSARPDAAKLVIRRDSGLLGVACGHSVRLDGKLIATLSAGQEITTYPSPGEHTVEASNSGVWCAQNTPAGASFVIASGQTKVFRTGFSGFDIVVSQVSETAAPPATPPAPMQPVAATPPTQAPRITEQTGQDAVSAERAARTEQCRSPSARLASKGAGFELYTVTCSSGEATSVRCEFGNCRVLR